MKAVLHPLAVMQPHAAPPPQLLVQPVGEGQHLFIRNRGHGVVQSGGETVEVFF